MMIVVFYHDTSAYTLYQGYLQAAGCRRCLCFFTEVYFVFCVLAQLP